MPPWIQLTDVPQDFASFVHPQRELARFAGRELQLQFIGQRGISQLDAAEREKFIVIGLRGRLINGWIINHLLPAFLQLDAGSLDFVKDLRLAFQW